MQDAGEGAAGRSPIAGYEFSDDGDRLVFRPTRGEHAKALLVAAGFVVVCAGISGMLLFFLVSDSNGGVPKGRSSWLIWIQIGTAVPILLMCGALGALGLWALGMVVLRGRVPFAVARRDGQVWHGGRALGPIDAIAVGEDDEADDLHAISIRFTGGVPRPHCLVYRPATEAADLAWVLADFLGVPVVGRKWGASKPTPEAAAGLDDPLLS